MLKDIFTNLSGVIQRPRQVFIKFRDEPKLFQAAFVIVVSALLSCVLNPQIWEILSPVYGGKTTVLFLFAMIFLPIMCLLFWMIGTAVLHLVARLFGHGGKWKAFTTCMGYMYVVILFMLPVEWLDYMAGTGFVVLFNLAVTIWMLALEVLAIRIVYDTSVIKAVLILCLPAVLSILLFIILFYHQFQAVLQHL